MSVEPDQQIALRLFEALILLVPVWIAVAKYVTEDKGEVTHKNIFGSFLIAISYALLLIAFIGLRTILKSAVNLPVLAISIDAIIFFILLATAGMFLGHFDQSPGIWSQESFRDMTVASTIGVILLIVVFGWLLLDVAGFLLERLAQEVIT